MPTAQSNCVTVERRTVALVESKQTVVLCFVKFMTTQQKQIQNTTIFGGWDYT